ncbi:MAG: hypothetical protein E7397_02180 [Ruminococcaceae bacterium]|nr:hypothetical protein [Oscillospiraceae bacterium]
MKSAERVRNTILGKPVDRQPIYGWIFANLSDEITEKWGSVENFEDSYEFDMAHIFGGPHPYNMELINKLKSKNDELTPDLLLKENFFYTNENPDDYKNIISAIKHHKKRDRFCYVQTPGFFESFNDIFGIENQLLYLAMYPDELGELYRQQAQWIIAFADRCIECGADMIHLSDDWGSQKDIMFHPDLWYKLIYPPLKSIVDHVHAKGTMVSLHSDGCIMKIADGLVEAGLDLIHPWQENAGMSYDAYVEKYADKFAILGGVCVQSALGIMQQNKLEDEIRRVFNQLKGKRWICCTSHFVQNHCTVDDLKFAYDLIYKLSRE